LAFTIGAPRAEVDFLDTCRRKRHTAVYDQVGAISDQEATEMIGLAKRLRLEVGKWLRKNHLKLVQ
jgi:hypothetical protein